MRVICLAGFLAGVLTVVWGNTQEYGYSDHGYVSDWNSDWAMLSGRLVHQPKCMDIPANLTLCRGIGYTQMRLPNLLEHDSIPEVTQQASSWNSLVNIACHPDTKLFLCSLFSPVCLDRPIWPCRALCEGVKAGCEQRMLNYGFPWPEMLRCDKFPLKNDLCIGLQTDNKPDESNCEPCNQPDSFEAIVDSYCRSSFALKIKVDEHVISGGDVKITANRKKKTLKKGDLKKRDLRSMLFYIDQGSKCECNALDSADKESSQEFLIMGNKIKDRMSLTHLQEYDKRAPNIRKAMRAIRKGDICKQGIQAIAPAPGGQPDDSKRKRRKNRKRQKGDESGKVGNKAGEGAREKKNRDSKADEKDPNRRRNRDRSNGRRREGRQKDRN